MKRLLACFLTLSFVYPLGGYAKNCLLILKGRELTIFDQIGSSKNLSQLFRSNARHYWKWFYNWVDNNSSKSEFEKIKGFVIGDAHAGNLGFFVKNGKVSWRVIDIDDMGTGSFFSDFAHLVTAGKVVFKDKIKVKKMTAQYLNGLRKGREVRNFLLDKLEEIKLDHYLVQDAIWGNELSKAPKWVLKEKENLEENYEKIEEDYIDKRIYDKRKKFKRERGELEDLSPSESRIVIESLTQQIGDIGYKVLDIGVRPKERGGSALGRRYWVLVEDINQRIRILEIKEYEGAALDFEKANKSEKLYYSMKMAWQLGSDISEYDIINIESSPFLMRPKTVGKLDTPYDDPKKFSELLEFDAYTLGLFHSLIGGESVIRYEDAVFRDPEGLRTQARTMIREYVEFVVDQTGKRN